MPLRVRKGSTSAARVFSPPSPPLLLRFHTFIPPPPHRSLVSTGVRRKVRKHYCKKKKKKKTEPTPTLNSCLRSPIVLRKGAGGRGLSRGNSPPELGRGRSLEFDVRKTRRTGGVKKKKKRKKRTADFC